MFGIFKKKAAQARFSKADIERGYIIREDLSEVIDDVTYFRIQYTRDWNIGDLGGLILSYAQIPQINKDSYIGSNVVLMKKTVLYGTFNITGECKIDDSRLYCRKLSIYNSNLTKVDCYGESIDIRSSELEYMDLFSNECDISDSTVECSYLFGEFSISNSEIQNLRTFNEISLEKTKISSNRIIFMYGETDIINVAFSDEIKEKVTILHSIVRDTTIKDSRDIITYGPIGSRDRFLTMYPDKSRNMLVNTGCQHLPLEEFKERVTETKSPLNKHRVEYENIYPLLEMIEQTHYLKKPEALKLNESIKIIDINGDNEPYGSIKISEFNAHLNDIKIKRSEYDDLESQGYLITNAIGLPYKIFIYKYYTFGGSVIYRKYITDINDKVAHKQARRRLRLV